jgi:polyisoprenoid-binding protein YceI
MFAIIFAMQTSTKFILAVIVLAIVGYFIFNYRSTPQDVQQATVSETQTQSDTTAAANAQNGTMQAKAFSISFTGYGPAGKTETGTFATSSFAYSGVTANGLPENGVAMFDVRSVSTGKAGLDKHLCADDFFMCAQFPEAKFVVTNVEQVPGTSYVFTGNLSFMGTEKSISFNANMIDGTFVGEFLLDITSFNFKYVGVDPKVLVKFNLGL